MDDLRATLMQMLTGRANGDAQAQLHKAVLARLNQRPVGDPMRDVIGRMLAEHSPMPRQRQLDPQALLRAARDALAVLQARQAVLAAALGACADCLGTETGCSQCNGLGKPGWHTPDPAAFAAWVAPAIAATRQPATAERIHEGEASS